jgi:predicted MPP superfamily phosphohydrolase
MNEDQLFVMFFDLLIAAVVFGVPWRLWRFWHGRRQAWKWPLAALLALGWLVVVYGSFVEPRRLVVTPVAVDLRPADSQQAPRKLRLAVVSDLHLGFYKGDRWAAKVAARLAELRTDAVVFAGDSVSSETGIKSLRAFRSLDVPLGKYAVLGNWDYHIGAVDVRKALGSQGVKTLVNRSVPLVPASVAGEPGLYLVGLDDLFYGTADWSRALAAVPPGATWIAAVHEPHGALWASHFGARLVLAGHTHGGQVRLPGLGALATARSSFLPDTYDKGLFAFFRTKLFITSGAGETGPRARLFNPPEIVLMNVGY